MKIVAASFDVKQGLCTLSINGQELCHSGLLNYFSLLQILDCKTMVVSLVPIRGAAKVELRDTGGSIIAVDDYEATLTIGMSAFARKFIWRSKKPDHKRKPVNVWVALKP